MKIRTKVKAGGTNLFRKFRFNRCLSFSFLILLLFVFALQGYSQERGEPQPSRPATEASVDVDPDLPASTVGKFVRIPAGEFMMGSNSNDLEKPMHKVRISRDFEMGKFEVTQAQWEAVMGSNPSYFKGPDLPVEQVSWTEVQNFIQALNNRSKRYNYRLPTEAEWEYACRAGSTGDYAGDLDSMAWYGADPLPGSNSKGTTHPVGQKRPNAWGLYDMHGNVWEWCHDWGGGYSQSPDTDPQGPTSGSVRVFRGGGWNTVARFCQSAFRYWGLPDSRLNNLGFRLVRTAQ